MGYVAHTPLPKFYSSQPSVLDFNGLSGLKLDAQRQGAGNGTQSAEVQKKVARQFEAIFIQTLLKQVRQTQENSGSQLFDSSAVRMSQSMSDEQTAMALADPGLGLADSLVAQMQGQHKVHLPAAGDITKIDVHQDGSSAVTHLSAQEAMAQRAYGARSIIAQTLDDLLAKRFNGGLGEMAQSIIGAVARAPEHVANFIDSMKGAAERASAKSGVPAELILGQAALETGWGKHEILREDGSKSYNVFGIKATGGWQGDVVHAKTTEYVNGRAQKVTEPFRAYGSYEEAFTDYAQLLASNDRYQGVLDAKTPQDAARAVQKAGYATDPAYAKKLITAMDYFSAESPVSTVASR